ncbi:MAG: ArgE/DapE family deacylase [Alphaproteobacteria bacterium]|nr:ArgE/DapE family deacylase [Alphaproteobacteria bacterium]MCZ6764390.1 ArgE/DapE family deacylase [Alphaproteobacteria bacterium]
MANEMADEMTDEASLAKELTAHLAALIAIPSAYPPGNTVAISAYAAQILEAAGYATEILAREKGIDNVVARVSGSKPGPSLVFNAHTDTVSVGARENWASDPFTAVEADGHVTGLGAGNCKGAMAAQLWLAQEVARAGGPARGELVFTFVGDEERLGHEGLYFLREAGAVKPDILVLGAQTENGLIVEERGVLWLAITTRGRAAHAGNPAAGDNAIGRMIRILSHLDGTLGPRLDTRVAGDKRSTVNIGMIRGGHNTNVVPDTCTVEIDRRLLPEEPVDDALAEMKEIVADAGEPADRVQVAFLTGTNGFSAATDGNGVTAFVEAIAARIGKPPAFLNATGVSDGRYFADDGIEIVNFGPGAGTQGHAANESVPVTELVDAALIQRDLVDRLLGLNG